MAQNNIATSRSADIDPIRKSLTLLANQALPVELAKNNRVVILSDMHLGNGGRGDDFRKNGELCMDALKRYYRPKGFTLILNGDIEELHRYTLREIEQAWSPFYEILHQFGDDGRLLKTIGNHDILLPFHKEYQLRQHLHNAICLKVDDDSNLFVFHGHQASIFQTHFNIIGGVFLRLIARPLGIRSYSVSADKKRQYRMERNVYGFSAATRIASIVGHTHRPLFESLSKADALRYQIEHLCREYIAADPSMHEGLGSEIKKQKQALDRLYERGEAGKQHFGIYNSKVLVPCLFNSGCAIGKKGITLVEIDGEDIVLVHWFTHEQGVRHIEEGEAPVENLPDTGCYRLVLKREKLAYIFTRINLLAD